MTAMGIPSVRAYTVGDVMRAGPCAEYTEARVLVLWAEREKLTAREIAALEIPYQHRCWALIELGLDDRTRRLFACDCAEAALARVPELDRRFAEVIEVARKYVEGATSMEELIAAGIVARDIIIEGDLAIRGAAWDAAWAVRYTARELAKFAAKAASWDGARSISQPDTWDQFLSWAVSYAEGARP